MSPAVQLVYGTARYERLSGMDCPPVEGRPGGMGRGPRPSTLWSRMSPPPEGGGGGRAVDDTAHSLTRFPFSPLLPLPCDDDAGSHQLGHQCCVQSRREAAGHRQWGQDCEGVGPGQWAVHLDNGGAEGQQGGGG